MGEVYSLSNAISRKAHALYDLGQYKTALLLYDRVTRTNPEEYWAWMGKGLTYSEMEDHWKGIYCYSHALRIDPEHPAAWNNTALCKWEVGYKKAAIRHYKQAVQLQVKKKISNSVSFRNLIMCYQELNQFTDALLVADCWLKTFPNSKDATWEREQFLADSLIPNLKVLRRKSIL